ncbi:MAG TPA: twin-arginine translocation signal domain-containing protein, partial [Ktedonobacteraceae bacterium]|nr:twin-arginine translocation signal domain-containing protein [Ktedonobacteraceae bacterium]
MTTRRQFLKIGAVAGAGTLLPLSAWRAFASVQTPQTPLLGANIPKYVDPMPSFVGQRVTSSTLTTRMLEFQQKALPESIYAGLPAPFNAGTFVWGYKVDGRPANWPGFTIEARQGTPTTVTYVNNLPFPNSSKLESLFTIDQTIHWADPQHTGSSTQPYHGTIPTTVHLHGAEVPSAFDGVPDSWFTQDGIHGKGYNTLNTDPESGVRNAATYQYPNTQPATMLWFHDHALGLTRINVFSGLAAAYLLRDQFDTGRADNPLGLP